MTTMIRSIAGGAVLLFSLTAGAAQIEGFTAARVLPADFKWVSTPTGLQVATIAGHQSKPGLYTARVKYPAGFRLQPHFHPDDRVIVVLSGTVYVGYGDKFDESRLMALPAGSVWTEPAKQPHYLWTKDGEAAIQVTGTGPSGSTQIPAKK
jgi:quercetin dioxygenase-like cupin family protein